MARNATLQPESDDRSLDIYMREIRRKDLITPEKEVELAIRIKDGERGALDELVQANLRFVVSVARQYRGRGLSLADLINEGNVGLIKAAERFDETRGFRFISYAIWWIRQSILQALNEQTRVVRIPINRAGKASKIERTARALEQELERPPLPEEIADALEMTVDEVLDARRYGLRAVSLDAPSHEEGDASLLSVLSDDNASPPDAQVVEHDLSRDLGAAIGTLDAREQKIVRDYFGLDTGEGVTLESIGKELGLTRERVRQLKERAIRKMLQRSDPEKLRSYLR